MHIENKFLRMCFSSLAFIMFNRARSVKFSMGFSFVSFLAEMIFGVHGLFSCSGAIITLSGLFLNIKHSLHFHLKLPKENLHYILSGAGVFGSRPTEKDIEAVDEILKDEIYGTVFMIVGTLIWAYGGYFVPSNP